MMLPISFKQFYHAIIATLLLLPLNATAAVILQYHHVSDTLPKVTSISASDFEQHLLYLKNNQFDVISLPELITALQEKKKLSDKTVAITFDDGFKNNYEQAAPLLEKYQFPYTIFVNPKLIDENVQQIISWEQLRVLVNKGATIANHSMSHDYLHHKHPGESNAEWLARIRADILTSEQRIADETGHNFKYLAYPYGEFNLELQKLVEEIGFIGFGQHSGAITHTNDFTRLPRYPASGNYSDISTLTTKLDSLAFPLSKKIMADSVTSELKPSITLHFSELDFTPNQFQCFISGGNSADLVWSEDNKSVTVRALKPLRKGRTRYNCTAPSKRKNGRYYWFSQPWVVVAEQNN